MKEFRIGPPKMCHFSTWIILSWRPSRPYGLMRNFYLSLKEYKLRVLLIIRVITRGNILWLICRAGQTSNYWTYTLIVLLMTFLPSEASLCLTLSSSHFNVLSLNLSYIWLFWVRCSGCRQKAKTFFYPLFIHF